MPLLLGGALQTPVISIDWRLFSEEPASQAITLGISQYILVSLTLVNINGILTRGSGREARNGKNVVESRILHSDNWRI